jgi:hypothetical protein
LYHELFLAWAIHDEYILEGRPQNVLGFEKSIKEWNPFLDHTPEDKLNFTRLMCVI